MRIQTLTRDSSQLLAENASLRQEIIHLQAELHRRDKQLQIHENNKGTIQLLEEKLADFNQLFKTLNQPVETESPYLPHRLMRSSYTPGEGLPPFMTPIEEEAQSNRTSSASSRRRSSISSIKYVSAQSIVIWDHMLTRNSYSFDLELPPPTTDAPMFNVGSRRRRDSVLIRPFQVDLVTEPDPSPVKTAMPEPEPEPEPEPSPVKAIVTEPSPVKAFMPQPESSPIKPASTPTPAIEPTPSLPARKALEPSKCYRKQRRKLPTNTTTESTNSEVTGTIGRAARRTRPAISYAEPNLRQKMRREDKGFVDAVSGEGKIRRSSSIKKKTSKEDIVQIKEEEPENARWKEFETETKPRVRFEGLAPAPEQLIERTKKARSASGELVDESERARIKKSKLTSSTDDEEDRKAARARRRSALV
jgi:hypothetical protein